MISAGRYAPLLQITGRTGWKLTSRMCLGLSRARCGISRRTGKPAARSLTRLYDTSVDDLWDALTSGERIARWFLPVEGVLQFGREISAQGQRRRDDHGLRAAQPFRGDMGIWRRGQLDRRQPCGRSAGQARLTLEHIAVIEDHWDQFGPGAVGIGWDLAHRWGSTDISRRARGRSRGRRGMDGFSRRQGVHERERRILARGACRKRCGPGLGEGTLGPDSRFLSWRAAGGCGASGYRKLMHVFDVLADPVRRRILELLGPGEMTSGKVVEAIGWEFGITRAAVSQHLKVLRESGFAQCGRTPSGGFIRSIPRDLRLSMRGSVSSVVSGSRNWTRWRRRSRAASATSQRADEPEEPASGRRHSSDPNRRNRQHGGRQEDSGGPVPLRRGAVSRSTLSDGFNSILPLHLLLLPDARRRRRHGGNGWAIKILQGEDALTSYRFHTGAAQHFFCSALRHLHPSSTPIEPEIRMPCNVACLDGVSPFDFPEVPVNGWRQSYQRHRQADAPGGHAALHSG